MVEADHAFDQTVFGDQRNLVVFHPSFFALCLEFAFSAFERTALHGFNGQDIIILGSARHDFEDGFAETGTVSLYDSYALYMAKALILEETGDELEKYLDVPAFARGDLYYIQKLVATIENYGSALNAPPDQPGHQSEND